MGASSLCESCKISLNAQVISVCKVSLPIIAGERKDKKEHMGKNKEGKPRSKFGFIAGFGCFIAFGVAAVVCFINYLLPLIIVDVNIGDTAWSVLNLIFEIAALIGLGFGALSFASSRGKLVKILTGIFVLVFIVAIVLAILASFGII